MRLQLILPSLISNVRCQDKEILFRKSAVDYCPMTNSKELSEKYCGDNMYQLLARQAISRLSGYFIANLYQPRNTKRDFIYL